MTAGPGPAPDADAFDALAEVIRSRHMVRAFTDQAVAPDALDELLDLARRAPSAGNTQPWELLVLTGDAVADYWATTLGARQESFRWSGLLAAPVLVLPYVRPAAYVERYAESDKASTGLGVDVDAWTVPYWWIDGGAAIQNLLLAVTAAGLGACLFGQFEHERAVATRFGVPADRRSLGTVAIGHAAPDEPGRSATRRRRALTSIVHRQRWAD